MNEIKNKLALSTLSGIQCTHIHRDGSRSQEQEEILTEHVIQVYLNDRLTMRLICLAEHLEELVIGRLYTEGILSSVTDITSIHINKSGNTARVYLSERIPENPPEQEPFVETTPTSCTSNHLFHNSFHLNRKLSPVTPIHWEEQWIFQLADAFAAGTPLHEKTFATHSCFLAHRDIILFSCEDIGRHNALDKAIGYALLQHIPLNECILYSSGRIPTDMVQKVIRAGIPILASKASPTTDAVALAQKYHLTLLCQARKDRMKQYS